MKSALHLEALRLASEGVPVFPCEPLSKSPKRGTRGFHDATTDPAQIDAWWAEKDYNIAYQPQRIGEAVIDIDGPEGEAAWFALELEHGSVETKTVYTPRGGRHLYYKGDLPPSVGKLAPHVDTRGGGSYALLPPSIFYDPDTGLAGTYRYGDCQVSAILPQWPGERLAALSREHVGSASDQLDQPANIARAVAHLKAAVSRGDVAVEGAMGDARTFAMCCEMMNLGLSADKTQELIEEHWNPHCQPPWDEDELRIKIENAEAYAQNEQGAWAVEPASVTFAEALGSLGVDTAPVPHRPRLLSEADQDALAEPTFLVPKLLPDRGIGMLYGAPGTFKSFLAVDLALTLASGLEGWGMTGQDQRAVVYVAGEGPHAIGKKRRPAWRMMKGLTAPVPFWLVEDMPRAAVEGSVETFILDIKDSGVKPSLVVIDTFSRFMFGLDESNAKDAGLAIAALEHMKRALDCTVLVLHHTGKDEKRGARGSSAFEGGFDAMHEVQVIEDSMAVAIWPRKQKDGEKATEPWMFEGKEFGGTLVFNPISRADYRTLAAKDDMFSTARVGQALADMGAYGEANFATTEVLAAQLWPDRLEDTPEQTEAKRARIMQTLRKLSKSSLKGQAYREGPGLRWGLPAPSEPE